MTVKKSLRQQYIETIMKNKYGDDDDEKYYDSNLLFLEELSLDELRKLAIECEGFNKEL